MNSEPRAPRTRPLSTALKTLALLDLIAEAATPCRPPDLARQLGWSRGTVYQQLVTLVAAGWVEQLPDGRYRLTLRATRAGRAALEQASLGERVLPTMRRLVDRTREASTVAVLDQDKAHVIQRVEPERTVRADIWLETLMPLGLTASGRVLMTFAEPDVRAAVAARGVSLPSAREMATVRREGYAVSDPPEPDDVDDALAVAVPVNDERGLCIAALALVGPADRIDVAACAEHLRQASRELDALWHVDPNPLPVRSAG